MKILDEVVKMYLEMDTNYALMITGGWGSGKTYYFKKELAAQIENISVRNTQLKYRPVLISLFGLKSIEEIQKEIFFSLYPVANNKIVKFGITVGSGLLKKLVDSSTFDELTKNVGSFLKESGTKDFVKFNSLVICFDDLERISPKLHVEEVIGFINSLIETENSKVIIITDEDKIKSEVYVSIKEKVVGNTIEFLPNQKESLESLITSKFKNNSDYQQFLLSNIEFILKIFANSKFNLRTLSFSFAYFEKVHKQVKALLTSETLKDSQETIFLDLLKFTLCIAIEYKGGVINYKDRKDLLEPNNEIQKLADLLKQEETQVDVPPKYNYQEEFVKRYYSEGDFKAYTSLYDFITGGNILDNIVLKQEVERHYHIKENQIPPQYILYNHLSYPHCFSLKPKEYKRRTSELHKFALDGKFELKDYPNIFHFLTRFGNPLNYNLVKLEKLIVKAINEAV